MEAACETMPNVQSDEVRMKKKNRYERLLEAIFLAHFSEGKEGFEFQRKEMEDHAKRLKIRLPKNLGDLIYSFRYRVPLPQSVQSHAPKGKKWLIRAAGMSRYRFVATAMPLQIVPSRMLAEIKVPDATPGVVLMYALDDEQALLAKLRYNRLIDLFTRVNCYSLQSHLRTTVPGLGQVETDELYVGVDRNGAHYVFPVQAKGPREKLNLVQIEQDMELCRHKYPGLVCRPIGAQFLEDGPIVLYEFAEADDGVRILLEKHYRLTAPDLLTDKDLEEYKKASSIEE